MPVRSLNSSVLKWPDASRVHAAVSLWAEKMGHLFPEIMAIGYFGSYARSDWGVGSDIDLLVIVEESALPFEHRAAKWETKELPVPPDLIIYTKKEWQSAAIQQKFSDPKMKIIWVYQRNF